MNFIRWIKEVDLKVQSGDCCQGRIELSFETILGVGDRP